VDKFCQTAANYAKHDCFLIGLFRAIQSAVAKSFSFRNMKFGKFLIQYQVQGLRVLNVVRLLTQIRIRGFFV
jgi:hypothetical protein